MENLNSIYYTFSTIAQMLAGFIALSGVFVLFKLQELNKMQLIQAQYFYNYMSGSGLTESSFHGCPNIAVNLSTLRKAESTAGMIEEINFILSDEKVKNIYQYKSLQSWKTIIEKVEKFKNMIKTLTITSIILGIITIIYSLIILGNAHLICEISSSLIITIGIVMATCTILIMTFGILLSIKNFKLLKKPAKI